MFWLLKKLISLALLALAIIFLLNLDYHGKPVRERLEEFVKSPLVKSFYGFAKTKTMEYLQKDLKREEPLDKLSDEERRELDELVGKQSEKK